MHRYFVETPIFVAGRDTRKNILGDLERRAASIAEEKPGVEHVSEL